MVSTLSDWLPAIGTAAEPEPDWATEITWTRSDELVSRLAEAEAELVAVTEARDVVERDLATERQWATLLWETGVDALESIVAAALAELGLNVERPSETEREDLRRADSDVVLIIEVTGSRRMIDLAKVRQLHQWVSDEEVRQADEGIERSIQGVLIANPHRELPRGARDESFSESALRLAERQGYELLTTGSLFDLVTRDDAQRIADAREWLGLG